MGSADSGEFNKIRSQVDESEVERAPRLRCPVVPCLSYQLEVHSEVIYMSPQMLAIKTHSLTVPHILFAHF